MAQKQARNAANPTRSENEVEFKRELGDWRRVLELLEPTKGKGTTNAEPLMNFLYGEARLESWLEDHQPTEKYISKAKSSLLDVKKTILLCLSQTGDQSGLQTDAHILLAKVNYACGLYEETLEELEKSRFENIAVIAQTVRNYQLMAEAHAMKAHCFEKVGRSWKGSSSRSEIDRKKDSIKFYLRASDLALAHFQSLEKIAVQNTTPTSTNPHNGTSQSLTTSPSPNPLSGQPPLDKKRASSLLDFAIRRGPTLLMEDGQMEEAIKRIQWMLRSQESQLFTPIRLILNRRLVEVLLRFKWIPSSLPPSGGDIRPKYHSGAKIFNPTNKWEEIFLTLLLSEIMVVRDGVLNQAPEFAKARKLANLNAASIFNLLALSACRWGQFSLINESLDKALKFSFEESHIWTQYGLTFHAAGHNSKRSIQTLVEASKLSNKKSTSLLLMAAKEQFFRLNIKAGLELIEIAKTKEQSENQKLLARVYLYEGIGRFLRSFEKFMNQQRSAELEASITALQKAAELDPMDYLTLHWLARTHAWMNNSNEAFAVAVKGLRAFPFHLPTLQLVVLLLSSQKNYSDGLALVEEILDEYPQHLGFLQLKAALEEKVFGPEVALGTLKQMLVIWKNLFDDGNFTTRCESPDSRHPGGGGMGTLQLPSPTERESASVSSFRAPSIAGSSSNTATFTGGFRADAALSEIASSISIHGSVLQSAYQNDMAWAAQINIWLMITDFYLKIDQPNQAVSSVNEAAQISATHPEVLYFRGQVAEYFKEYSEARTVYEGAVAVRPTHVKALQSLALMQHYFGSHRLAEKTLQDALKLDPHDHTTWYNLGKVLEALGECSEAGDCMATALEIEAIAPILPYSTIPICFE